MEQDRKSPILSCLEVTFEEFNAGIVALDGRTDLVGPELGPWRQETLYLDGAHLQIMMEGGANTYTGGGSPDFISFGVSLHCPEPIYVTGVRLMDCRMALIRPGETVSSFAVAECCYCVFTIPVDRCVRSCENYCPLLTERLLTGSAVLEISKKNWRRIVLLIERVMRVARSGEIFTNRNVQVVVAEELIRALLDAVASRIPASTPIGRPRSPRRQVVARVGEYLKAVDTYPGSVAEMARYVGIPERTLRSIVREMLGVTPKRLMKMKTLNDIHQALLQESGPRTVTEIAVEHGEWELGRLARNYHDIFGEYPSETLATRCGCA